MTIKERKIIVESPAKSPLPRSPDSSNKKISPSAKTTAAGILVSMINVQNELGENEMDKGDIHSRSGIDNTERPETHINASTTISALPNPGDSTPEIFHAGNNLQTQNNDKYWKTLSELPNSTDQTGIIFGISVIVGFFVFMFLYVTQIYMLFQAFLRT